MEIDRPAVRSAAGAVRKKQERVASHLQGAGTSVFERAVVIYSAAAEGEVIAVVATSSTVAVFAPQETVREPPFAPWIAESIEAVSDALKALPRIKAGTLAVLALQKYSAVGLMKELL